MLSVVLLFLGCVAVPAVVGAVVVAVVVAISVAVMLLEVLLSWCLLQPHCCTWVASSTAT